MNPDTAAALATQHRHDMTARAGQAALARRPAPRAHLRGGLFPRYRVSWSRATLTPAAGGRRGRSWIIVISATRAL